MFHENDSSVDLMDCNVRRLCVISKDLRTLIVMILHRLDNKFLGNYTFDPLSLGNFAFGPRTFFGYNSNPRLWRTI